MKPRPVLSPQLMDLCIEFGLTCDDINNEVSNEDLLYFYPLLMKWELVAAHLGLKQGDIQHHDITEEDLKRLYMLQDWKRMKSHGIATYKVLLEALIKCKCSEVAEQVCCK